MTTPIFANLVLTAGQDQLIASVDTSNILFATLSLNVLNNNQTTDAQIQIAFTTQSAPTAADWIEKGSVVPMKGGVLYRNCELARPGEKVFVRSSVSDVVVRLSGLAQETT